MRHDRKAASVYYAGQALRATERAMRRAAALAHEDLKHGLNTLATITCLAPLIGILGTLWAIGCDTFFGLGTDKYTGLAMVARGISRACVPTALGLLVGLHSLWSHKYLRGRLEDFDREVEGASLSLINQLALNFGRLRIAAPTQELSDSLPYLEAYSPDLQADRRYNRRAALAATALLIVAWCLQAIVYFERDAVPPGPAIFGSVRSLAVIFCCSCVPAYAVWVDLFHRKSRRVPLIAAALSLCWCTAGLFTPAFRF